MKPKSIRRTGVVSVPLAAACGLAVTSGSSSALPANPQRPFQAQTCDDALVRLAEAETGSPLISDAENAQVLIEARAQVERLCATVAPQPADPTDLTQPTTKDECDSARNQ